MIADVSAARAGAGWSCVVRGQHRAWVTQLVGHHVAAQVIAHRVGTEPRLGNSGQFSCPW
jgi:hypothetical protein